MPSDGHGRRVEHCVECGEQLGSVRKASDRNACRECKPIRTEWYKGEIPKAPIDVSDLDRAPTNMLLTWPKYWVTTPYYKWKTFTWFGKLLFPMWLIASVGAWLCVFCLLTVGLAAVCVGKTVDWVVSKLPEVHKNGH